MTMTRRPIAAPPYDGGTDTFILVVVGVLVAELAVLGIGATLAALVFGGHHLLGLSVPAVVLSAAASLGNVTHPALAWQITARADLPGPVAYWSTTAVVQTAAGLGAWAGWRVWSTRAITQATLTDGARGRRSPPGFANRAQVRRNLSARAVRARAPQIRPSLAGRQVSPEDVAIGLGRDVASGIGLWSSLEESCLVLGPPRVGKGVNFIIPGVLASPGAAVVTATRTDTLLHTACARAEHGPVAVFDPQGSAQWPDGLRWAPQKGCRDSLTAILRAKGFAAAAGLNTGSVTNGDYWQGQTAAVVRCYLHAADLDGRPIRDVLRWVGHPGDPTPVDILRVHPEAAPGWAEELHDQATADARQRDQIWTQVRRAFDSLADPRVLDACSPPAGVEFDAETFLRRRGTLYLVGSADAQLSIAPLITALIEDLVATARKLAARSPYGRLDPPLALWLDEAANIAPLPSLPSLLSDGGGTGIPTVAVLQSLGQGRARWGQAATDAMWDAATTKVVFGGLATIEDLTRIANLAGDVDQETMSRSRGKGAASTSSSLRRIPALSASQVRTLPKGRALIIHQHTPIVEAALDPWWRRPIASAVRAALAEATRITGITPEDPQDEKPQAHPTRLARTASLPVGVVGAARHAVSRLVAKARSGTETTRCEHQPVQRPVVAARRTVRPGKPPTKPKAAA